ncbi:hypothetical protein J7M28_05370 [bacterium]|nr:hypothetical protein [bacterium]
MACPSKVGGVRAPRIRTQAFGARMARNAPHTQPEMPCIARDSLYKSGSMRQFQQDARGHPP